MNREELKRYIREVYGADPDFPWVKYPDYEVFRHQGNRKWFAVVMDLPREKLGLQGEGALTIVNVKCDPLMIGPLRSEPGFFPAYHMNKDSWITAALDGSAAEDRIKMLLDISFTLTAPKAKNGGAARRNKR